MKRDPGNEVTALFFQGFGGENDCPDYSVQNDGHTEEVKCSWKNNCLDYFRTKRPSSEEVTCSRKKLLFKKKVTKYSSIQILWM